MAISGAREDFSVAIVGGGYAGIATAIELNKNNSSIAVTLFDARAYHQKLTQWHKLARGARSEKYEVAFSALAGKFGFRFCQQHVAVDALLVNPTKTLGRSFDAIVVAQGSLTPSLPSGVITLDQLRDDTAAQQQVRTITGKKISIIGAGPTGVQFAFEFAARNNEVTLYEARDRVLPTFDPALGTAAMRAIEANGIRLHLETEFVGYTKNYVVARGTHAGENAADLVLFVPGVRATPHFTCDLYGRVEGTRSPLYAAGDNSYFSGRGLNSKSAQAAVRKGQQVARTIIADAVGKSAPEYTYAELGYFVSLGPKNAVGYMFSQKTAFSGRAALLMKEIVERQYDLYLAGFNVYP
ncbi:MAG: FAD-dependent oxidoreductase [Spirochaetes bacterium]|nr:FAD-dependent oxidoreductase [Spirochaetota bacterium]